MEKITQEVFRSGDKIFLTEGECRKYESSIYNSQFIGDIKNFLIGEGFNLTTITPKPEHRWINSETAISLTVHGDFKIIFEFRLKMGCPVFTLRKYCVENNLAPGIETTKEEISLAVCPIETFKSFYSMLKITS